MGHIYHSIPLIWHHHPPPEWCRVMSFETSLDTVHLGMWNMYGQCDCTGTAWSNPNIVFHFSPRRMTVAMDIRIHLLCICILVWYIEALICYSVWCFIGRGTELLSRVWVSNWPLSQGQFGSPQSIKGNQPTVYYVNLSLSHKHDKHMLTLPGMLHNWWAICDEVKQYKQSHDWVDGTSYRAYWREVWNPV